MDRRQARDLFGLADDFTPEDLKLAYRRLALLTHPDAGGVAAAFRQVHDAYEFLLSGRQTAEAPPTASAKESQAPPKWNFDLAALAMAYLGIDPDTFATIEDLCHSIDGQVSEARKRAAKQLLWLAVGRIPVGAAVTVAKTQKYRNRALRMLETLGKIQTQDGIRIVGNWYQFGDDYKSLLEIINQEHYADEINLAEYHIFLKQCAKALNSRDSGEIEALRGVAQKTGEAYTVIDHSRVEPEVGRLAKWARQRGQAVGARTK